MAACHLIPLLNDAERKGQIVGEVVVVPAANPIGMAQSLATQHHGRIAFADGGQNFNRGWPDLGPMTQKSIEGKLGSDPEENVLLVRAALVQAVAALPAQSEREAHQKALLSLSIDADVVFDLHCDFKALFHLFANEEHKDLAMALGQDLGSSVVILEKSIDGGLFDECNGGPWIKLRRSLGLSPDHLPAACFCPTIELRGRDDVSADLGGKDAANIMNFLRRRGYILGKPPQLPKARCAATPIEGCDMVHAPCAGMLVWHKPVGASVTKGDHLADIIDIESPDPMSARTEVRSKQSGVLFSHRIDYLTRPGEILGQIAGPEPLAHREGAQFLNP